MKSIIYYLGQRNSKVNRSAIVRYWLGNKTINLILFYQKTLYSEKNSKRKQVDFATFVLACERWVEHYDVKTNILFSFSKSITKLSTLSFFLLHFFVVFKKPAVVARNVWRSRVGGGKVGIDVIQVCCCCYDFDFDVLAFTIKSMICIGGSKRAA